MITYDSKKDRINKRKHGILLSRAADFDFEGALYTVDDREDYGEIRFRAISFLDARLYALVFVDEDESDNLRAISLRKATKHEAKEFKASR